MDRAVQHDAPPVTPLISAIVPVHDGASYLSRSLPAVCEALASVDGEVLVVDDGSTDGSGDVARRAGAQVIETGGPFGAARARNLGAGQARGEILVFVDADVVPEPGAVRDLLAHLGSAGYAAAFGSYDPRRPGPNFASRYMNLRHHFYHRHGKRDADSFWCGLGVVRHRAFVDAGGLDPAYEGIEDVELGARLRQAGHRIRLDPDCRGEHLKRWTLWQVLCTDIFKRALPWSRLLNRRGAASPTLNTGRVERIRAGVALLLLLSAPLAVLGTLPAIIPVLLGFTAGAANRRFVVFMAHREGMAFAAAAIVYHQFYYFYSTAVYIYCKGEAMLQRRPGKQTSESTGGARS